MDLHLNTPSQLVAKVATAFQNLPGEVQFADNSTIVVAISGGPDSTALLVALHWLSKAGKVSIRACHVNHKLRGLESEQDEDFCKFLCEKLSVPLDIYRVEGAAADLNASESHLRATRYDFLFQCAQASGSRLVVLAHNSNDQVETVLFRILRGTSPKGMTGMKDAHQMRNGIWLLRPMLACSRDEVRDFLDSCAIVARQDSSNQNSKYARNFLRNQVIPLCVTRFPTMDRQIERLRELVVHDQDFIDSATRAVIAELGSIESNTWSVRKFAEIHIALQHRLLAEAFALRSIEVSFERVEVVLSMMASGSDGEGRVSLNSQWDIEVDAENIKWIDKRAQPDSFHFSPVNLKFPGRTMVLQLGQVFNIEEWVGSEPAYYPARADLEAYVDLSQVVAPLVLRAPEDSDRITPLGMSQSVSLKRYLKNNSNESPSGVRRDLHNVLFADSREVLWVPGVGLSETVRVRIKPTHHLSISAISADFTSA
ncbi:MAG TPA: tRNA lysidine(34) synthetase TilS [Drouetiella sp.]|jgi:tRNA(Ile)-lysidine synthase